jgi:histone-binding protein RBBP4
MEQRVLLGTNTSGKARDELIIARIISPKTLTAEDKQGGRTAEDFNQAWEKHHDDAGEIGGYGTGVKAKSFDIQQRIVHDGEVNKARLQPSDRTTLIATTGVAGQVAIFDWTKHPNLPTSDEARPDMLLIGHESEGWGLNWDPFEDSRLVTASTDQTVRVWDLEKYQSSSKEIEAIRVLQHHNASANDAEFNPLSKNIIATVGDDKRLCVIDLRDKLDTVGINIVGSKDAINALAWHPDIGGGHMILTGDAEGIVKLWDTRRGTKGPLQSLQTHTGAVNKVQWHPDEAAICASCSSDRQIHFYDLNKNGDELTAEELEDGPPQLYVF